MHPHGKDLGRAPVHPFFQFPLLGFLLCISKNLLSMRIKVRDLSIPFIGIFALHPSFSFPLQEDRGCLSIPFIGIFALHLAELFWQTRRAKTLSIPFIGIFALHLTKKKGVEKLWMSSFNSLYWDFCFASLPPDPDPEDVECAFNSLYWDFCFASVVGFWLFCRLRLSLGLFLIYIFDYYLGVIWFIKIIEISLFYG